CFSPPGAMNFAQAMTRAVVTASLRRKKRKSTRRHAKNASLLRLHDVEQEPRPLCRHNRSIDASRAATQERRRRNVHAEIPRSPARLVPDVRVCWERDCARPRSKLGAAKRKLN